MSKTQPPDYAVIDVETTLIADGEIPQTKFWGYADDKGYKRFDTTREFARFLRSISKKTLLHHANFDVLQLLVDGEKLQILRSHNGKLIRSQIGKHTMLNTFACFPVALKKEDPEAHKNTLFGAFGKGFTSLDSLEERNYEDCVTGLEVFMQLNELFYKLCGVRPLSCGTIAGTAFRAAEMFVGRDMPGDNRFLAAYRGGRVEVFDLRCYMESDKTYQEHVDDVLDQYNEEIKNNLNPSQPIFYDRVQCNAHKFDINSSYPKSILDCPEKTEIWRIKVDTQDFHCPFFDTSREDLLFFPNGRFTSYVYRDVFERYIEPHMERTSVRVISRHKLDMSWLCELKPFIETIYETKRTANGGIKIVCKFLLNSFYGRIGLRGDSERARFMDYRPDGDEVTAYRLGPKVWLVFDRVQRENNRANFPFAGYITDSGRGRLFAGFKQNHTLYGDTDSLVSSAKNFVGDCGDGCGAWKYEGSEAFQAINVKDYLWGEDEVRKGGSEYYKWTLKQFAKGATAEKVIRTRTTELRKREVLPSGETVPIVV